MAITLEDFAASDTNYVQKLNNNNTVLETAINSLQAAMSAIGGEASQLVTDMWDRDGVVGPTSYVLDLENYAGDATIDIGRRPAPNLTFGEVDLSIAYATYGGVKTRVSQAGDVTLNAAIIISGLPKTIYVGIASSGAAALYEDTLTPSILYVYSMTWDGFQLTSFKRMAPIMPSYSLLQSMAGVPKMLQVFDSETDWVSDVDSASDINFVGAADDNSIEVDGSLEILGWFMAASNAGEEGFYAPAGVDNLVTVRVIGDDDEIYSDEDLEFDCSNIPDVVFTKIEPGVGDEKFVTEVRTFHLERVGIGADVVSARCFTWGAIVRPIIGIAIPKDTGEVIEI